jgi:hypothetical protein
MLYTDQARALLDFLKKNPDFDGQIDETNKLKVQNLSDYVKIQSLLYEELYQGLELNELHDEAARLQADLVGKFIKTEKIKLSEQQRTITDETELRAMQEQDKLFNQLLNQVKGAARG